MKALVVGTQRDQVTKAQWEPFLYYQKELQRQLDLKLKTKVADTFSEIAQVCEQDDADIIFIIPFWKESASEAEAAIKKIRHAKPQVKIVFIDPWAQVNSRYFNILDSVDFFLKRQRYSDLDQYLRDFEGGSMFTEFLAKEWDVELKGWDVSSQVPEGYTERIMTGWNLGTAKAFKKQLQRPKFLDIFDPPKTIDVFCRLSLGKSDDWYSKYRKKSVEALEPLEDNYEVAISGRRQGDLVSLRQYYQDLKRSKIVFSPFGWGENCWRDFEAICNNCLLVKPSMAHIHTQPNIFLEYETYIPVRWDLADLEEKIAHYLEHWEKAQQIIAKARQVYAAYFQEDKFLKTIQGIIAK